MIEKNGRTESPTGTWGIRRWDDPRSWTDAVQAEQRVLRTEAAVHVPERIMRQSASRIAHECFRLNYQIPPALACRRSNVDAAQGRCLGTGAGRSGRRFQAVRQFASFQQSRQRFPNFFRCGAKAVVTVRLHGGRSGLAGIGNRALFSALDAVMWKSLPVLFFVSPPGENA